MEEIAGGTREIYDILISMLSEVRLVSGSEGLYQCMLYHHARLCLPPEDVIREYPISFIDPTGKPAEGKIDLLLRLPGREIAIEIKAGANSYRNSLKKAKEVDSKYMATGKGHGLLHDFQKLSAFIASESEDVDIQRHALQLCVEPLYFDLAFNQDDIKKYADSSRASGIHFLYFDSRSESMLNAYNPNGQLEYIKVPSSPMNLEEKSTDFLHQDKFWKGFLADLRQLRPHCEAMVEGALYHAIRDTGTTARMCCSEVYMPCLKEEGTRDKYLIPDVCIFSSGFHGRFGLGRDRREKEQSDYDKLTYLESLIEIKGHESFDASKNFIDADLKKLSEKIPERLRSRASKFRVDCKTYYFVMLVYCDDPVLGEWLHKRERDLGGSVRIIWSGDYL